MTYGRASVEDKLMMDRHKLYWHLDRVSGLMKEERISPLHIDLGVSTGCNMSCKYCYGVLQGRSNAAKAYNMPGEAILRLLKDSKLIGVRSVAFIGEGENTLNEHLYDSLNYAKEINLDVSLATNGIFLKQDRITDMLQSVVWLRFNFSAASPHMFSKVHRVTEEDYASIVDNIQTCVKIKEQNALKTTIGLQMVVIEDNMQDIIPLAKLGKEFGVNYLVIKACSDTYDNRLKSPLDQYVQMKDIFEEAESYSTREYSIVVKWDKLTNGGHKDYNICYGTQLVIAISATGDVFPCGHFFKINREDYLMGNIINQTFQDIVMSDRYWEVQKKIQTVNVNKSCESNCRQHYINMFLHQLKSVPSHMNFI